MLISLMLIWKNVNAVKDFPKEAPAPVVFLPHGSSVMLLLDVLNTSISFDLLSDSSDGH